MPTWTSPSSARLLPVHVPRTARGVVVVLHGGASRPSSPMVSPTQLSVLRMIPVARRIARGDRSLAVFRLLNSVRGWDTSHTPVHDAHWALDRIAESLPGLPAGLVGHSLGGRAALLAGTHDGVRAVVALNPWVYGSEDVDLRGRRVLVVHGSDDRIASPDRSAALARRLGTTTEVRYETIPGGKHAMLRHGRRFERLAAEFVTGLVPGSS